MNKKNALASLLGGAILGIAAPILLAHARDVRVSAQAPATGTDFSAFVYDVVSIKPHRPDPNAVVVLMGSQETPEGFTGTNIPLTVLVGAAYRNDRAQMSGQPDWLTSARYDVEAKMDPAVADALNKLSPADQKLARKHMMQVLVQDRMKVAVHMDSKEVATYDLTIAKNGIKMKEVTDPNAAEGNIRASGAGGGAFQLEGRSVPASSIARQLTASSGRPVYDKTGLTGKYDFTLKFTPERLLSAAASATDATPALDTAPPLAKALEEQLGLKLVIAKGAMDVIVIDHVEKPSPN